MNYKHLGKFHYIYKMSFGADNKLHLEKFPIVYSNKHYVYISVYGKDELERLTLKGYTWYDQPDIVTEFTEELKEKCKLTVLDDIATGRYNRRTYFMLYDISQVKNFVDEMNSLTLKKASLMHKYVISYKNRINIIDKINSLQGELKKLNEELDCLADRIAGLEEEEKTE